MKILAFAEQRDLKIKKSSMETVQAARAIADQLGASFAAVIAGSGVSSVAKELGRYGAARVIALRLSPGLAPAHYNLGVILAAQGRAGEAAGQYREALRLNPGFAEARRNLGLLTDAQRKNSPAAGGLK